MQIIYFIFKVDWRCVNKWGVLILRGKGVPSLSHTFTGYVAFTMQWVEGQSLDYLSQSLLVSVKCNDNQIKCGEMPPKDYPDCLPDEICVPMDCFCKYRNQSINIVRF